MAATASPYGLKPVSRMGGRGGDLNIRQLPMTSNTATGIFYGDLVSINGGQPTAITATPVGSSRDTATPVGVCVGCEFTDPTMGRRFQQYLPANAVTAGYTNILVHVIDDPNAIFQVQADGAVTQASMGKNAPLGNFSAGSTATGNSKVNLVSGSIGTGSTLAVRIIGFVDEVGFSVVGDAKTDCLVMFNFGVHAYLIATGA